MKILKKIGIGLLAIILLAAVIGFFMPGHYQITRSLDIKAAPANVFSQINVVKNWEKWSPWQKMDPSTVITYHDIPEGKGAAYSWTSEKMGKGTMTITESLPDTFINTRLDFDGEGQGTAFFRITPKEGGVSTVTWQMESDLGMNPFTRLMYQMMRGMMEKTFDDGLASIRDIAEKMPAPAATSGIKVEETTYSGGPYLYMHDSASISTIGQKLGAMYGQISASMKKQGLNFAGPVFAIYYTDSETNWELDACIPVDKAGKDDGAVKAGSRADGKAVVAHFFGDYTQTPAAHQAAAMYIESNGKKIIGAPWEVYITDPMVEKDTAKWATDVCYPIQ